MSVNAKLQQIIKEKNEKAVKAVAKPQAPIRSTGANGVAMWWGLLRDAFNKWNADKAPRLGAALSYYTVFSLVPLLVVIIAITGLVFGAEAAQNAIMTQIESMMGDKSAAAIREMLQIAQQPSSGILASIIAIGTLLVGASGVFAQLQDALNTVWGIEAKQGGGIWALIKDRFLSFVSVRRANFVLSLPGDIDSTLVDTLRSLFVEPFTSSLSVFSTNRSVILR